MVALLSVVAAGVPGPAGAQTEGRRYAEEPTGGVELPATPLAGDPDALATVVNPAGLVLLGGTYLGLGLDLADEGDATGAGRGFGLYLGQALGGGVLPRLGLGFGAEFLRPPRTVLSPDPGTPTRFTIASAMPLGTVGGLGLSWHRFTDDPGQSLSGVTTWDLGLTARLGSHFAFGAVVRDLNAPVVAGVPVQRRYEAELVTRPGGTERLELALGGRVGETRGDVDGWLRWSARLARGLYFQGAVESRDLHVLDYSPSLLEESGEREYRLSAGFALSFGSVGATTLGTGALDESGDARLGGVTLIARASTEELEPVQGRGRRIERIDLRGTMTAREHTLLVARLRRLGRDPSVAAVFVAFDGLQAGWGACEELHQELYRLRHAGIEVFAYLVAGTTAEYFVASAANKVYVDPAGGLRLAGFAGTLTYYHAQLTALGINPEFEKIEEYKSAPEMFTRDGPSEPALRMRNELYDSIYHTLVAGIARGRGLEPGRVRQLIDRGPYSAGDLEKMTELVDAVTTPDGVAEQISKELGRGYPVAGPAHQRPDRWSYPAIAVIHLDGDIVDGKSYTIPILDRRLAGSRTIAGAIAAARANPKVVAIVLRIDSPGGSAVASEMMSREVFATRGVKPIICSMGDVAASGGYFAAAGCDEIFADAMTITGSIGIFTGKFDLSKLFGRVGLHWLTVKRGRHADMDGYFRPYTEQERTEVKTKLRYFYNRFVDTVAEGRGMTADAVDKVARGRVWSGEDAKPLGLVTRIGTIGDAIALAKQRAGLGDRQPARLVLLPTPSRGLIERLLGFTRARAEKSDPDLEFLARLPGVEALLGAIPGSLLVDPGAVQARLPFTIVWQ